MSNLKTKAEDNKFPQTKKAKPKNKPQKVKRVKPIKPVSVPKSNEKNNNNKSIDNEIKKQRKKKIKKIEYTVLDLIPYVCPLEDGTEGFLLNDGKYVNIFRILGQDYPNMMESDVRIQLSLMDSFYRTLGGCTMRLVNISMPLDISNTIEYYKRKRIQAKNAEYRELLKEEIETLKKLSQRQNRLFYLEIFADKEETLNKINSRIRGLFFSTGIAKEMTYMEKVQYLHKKNNPYSM